MFVIKKKISIEKLKWFFVIDRRIIYFDEKVFGRYDFKVILY